MKRHLLIFLATFVLTLVFSNIFGAAIDRAFFPGSGFATFALPGDFVNSFPIFLIFFTVVLFGIWGHFKHRRNLFVLVFIELLIPILIGGHTLGLALIALLAGLIIFSVVKVFRK